MLSQVCQAGQGHGSNGAVQLHDRRRPEGLVEITSKRPSYQLPRFQGSGMGSFAFPECFGLWFKLVDRIINAEKPGNF